MTAASNKQIVMAALDELFGERDIAAIDRYFADNYLQHNPHVANGAAGLKQFVQAAILDNPQFSALRWAVLEDGDRVAVYGRYTGFGTEALVGFDVFRVEAGRLAEHWDCLQGEIPDSPASPDPERCVDLSVGHDTASSRRLVTKFCEEVLLPARLDRSVAFASPRTVLAAVERSFDDPERRRYQRVHHTVAEGNLVLVMSEGRAWGDAHVFYDLFDVRSGQITGLWRAAQPVQEKSVSGLGML